MEKARSSVGSERVRVLAPAGRDAALCAGILRQAGIDASPCDDVDALCRAIGEGLGGAVLVEEVLTPSALATLEACIAQQEPWSDVPLVVFTAQAQSRRRPLEAFAALGNVRLLDRPIDPRILVSAVESALRARRRQYEAVAARRRDEADLRAAAEFQHRLIGIAGHDLRSPLASIMMSASLARRRPLDEHAAKQVTRILSAAKRMERIITDLADYSRAQVGRPIPVAPRPANIHAICESLLDELAAAHPGSSITYDPEGDPAGHWDVERLQQVVENLLTNALKYGDPARPIVLSWRRTGRGEVGEDLIVRVTNYGPPIPPELLGELFEPFRLGEQSPASGTRSLGLGLFIVREIVRAHRGEIGVTSTESDGTTFTVRLPRDAD